MNACRLSASLLLIILLLGQGGCSLWAQIQAPVPDVKPARKARSAQLVKEYGQRRDEAQYQAALSAWNQGNTETCRELIDTLLERSPQHRSARLLSVQVHMLDQELPEAGAEASKLAQDYPGDAEVLHVQGLACEAAGDMAQAEKCYLRTVEIDPKNEVFAASLAGIDEGSNSEAGELESGKPAAATLDADGLSATLLKAEVHLALGETEAARRLAEKAAAQMPSHVETQSLLARICQVTDGSGEDNPRRQSAAQRRAGNTVQPASYDARDKRPDPLDDDPLSNASDLRLKQSTFTGLSASAARPASSANPASAASNRSQASAEEYLRRGEAALAADTPAAARSYFQRAIATAPDDENVAVNAAVAALRHNYPELAAELAQSALPRWPKSAALYRTLGMAEYRLEHWQPAQAALRQALSLDNSHALSYFLLGCTLRKLGQNEEADRNFRQARQLDSRYALKP